MKKTINIEKTSDNIIYASSAFKLFETSEADSRTLITNVDDNFARSVIIISSEMIAAGVQAPDEDGKITMTYTPIGLDLLNAIEYDEHDDPEITEDTKATKGK